MVFKKFCTKGILSILLFFQAFEVLSCGYQLTWRFLSNKGQREGFILCRLCTFWVVKSLPCGLSCDHSRVIGPTWLNARVISYKKHEQTQAVWSSNFPSWQGIIIGKYLHEIPRVGEIFYFFPFRPWRRREGCQSFGNHVALAKCQKWHQVFHLTLLARLHNPIKILKPPLWLESENS